MLVLKGVEFCWCTRNWANWNALLLGLKLEPYTAAFKPYSRRGTYLLLALLVLQALRTKVAKTFGVSFVPLFISL